MDSEVSASGSSTTKAKLMQLVMKRSSQSYRFMLLPMEGTGHVLTMIGLASLLHSRNHKVTFVVSKAFHKYLQSHPFEVKFVEDPSFYNLTDPQERWANSTVKHSVHFFKPPHEQLELQADFYKEFVDTVVNTNDQIAVYIQEVKPDYIFVDYYVTIPAVVQSGIPWSCFVSANPLCAYRDIEAPPSYSGYSPTGDTSIWAVFKTAFDEAISESTERLHRFARDRGVTLEEGKIWTPSNYGNIYVYPSEIDYHEISPRPPHLWARIDHLLRPCSDSDLGFNMADLKANVRRIYFTLGSMGSADLILMNRLLEMLSKTPYQYIVSKGPNHEKFALPPNAVGSQYLNQLKVLEMVDLVIFHGGNNTLNECLYFGKPMIILPLFGDQFDNATRVVEKMLGYAFRPYLVTQAELSNAIHDLLTDYGVLRRLGEISHRLERDISATKTIESIEKLVLKIKNKSPK